MLRSSVVPEGDRHRRAARAAATTVELRSSVVPEGDRHSNYQLAHGDRT